MTIQHAVEADLRTAANYGMANFAGDPEVAEELGIAFSPEALERQVYSGALVAELSDVSVDIELTPAQIARQEAHDIYVKTLHVQDKPVPYADAALKASNAGYTAGLKKLIEPTRFQV